MANTEHRDRKIEILSIEEEPEEGLVEEISIARMNPAHPVLGNEGFPTSG